MSTPDSGIQPGPSHLGSLFFAYVPVVSGVLLNLAVMRQGNELYYEFFRIQAFLLLGYSLVSFSMRNLHVPPATLLQLLAAKSVGLVAYLCLGLVGTYLYLRVGPGHVLTGELMFWVALFLLKKVNDLFYESQSVASAQGATRFVSVWLPALEFVIYLLVFSQLLAGLQSGLLTLLVAIALVGFVRIRRFVGLPASAPDESAKKALYDVRWLIVFGVLYALYSLLPRVASAALLAPAQVVFFGQAIAFFFLVPPLINLVESRLRLPHSLLALLVALGYAAGLLVVLPLLYPLLGVPYQVQFMGVLAVSLLVYGATLSQLMNLRFGRLAQPVRRQIQSVLVGFATSLLLLGALWLGGAYRADWAFVCIGLLPMLYAVAMKRAH